MVAAAFMSYAGPFPSEYRAALVDRTWLPMIAALQIPASVGFSFSDFLADPSDVRDWNILGLPADAFSTENGVMTTRGRRWPLMIDPQARAATLAINGSTPVLPTLRGTFACMRFTRFCTAQYMVRAAASKRLTSLRNARAVLECADALCTRYEAFDKLRCGVQGQANKWVKSMEGRRGLKVLNLQTGDLARQVENAIQFGNPVLLQVRPACHHGLGCTALSPDV